MATTTKKKQIHKPAFMVDHNHQLIQVKRRPQNEAKMKPKQNLSPLKLKNTRQQPQTCWAAKS